MTIPHRTAECSLGPARNSYMSTGSGGPGATAVTSMDFFGDLSGAFSGVLTKVPCLIGCGLPNALSLVTRCGIDPVCWVENAPSAVGGCIRQCLQ